MLHCASVAAVERPLALVAGELAVAAVGTGVAQIQGAVCVPSSTGPPTAWFVIASCAPPKLLFVELTVIVLAPSLRPLTRPTVRPSEPVLNAEVTSVPFSATARLGASVALGSLTSTKASPPLIRSARFDSVVIVAAGGWSSPPPHPAR